MSQITKSFKNEQAETIENKTLFQISNQTAEINTEEAEVYIEFVLDGVLPEEEKVFPLSFVSEPFVEGSGQEVAFNTYPLCGDEFLHINVCCFLVLDPYTGASLLKKKIFLHLSHTSLLVTNL